MARQHVEIGEPRKLFQVPVNLTVGHGNEYGVSKNGQEFFVSVLDPAPPITVTVNLPSTRTPRRVR
jgi:hypothetical protein